MNPTALSLLIVSGNTLTVYVFLAICIRVLSRRQLGQLSAMDLLIIILLGSAVETAMVHGDTSLKAGLVSGSTLFAANRLFLHAMARSRKFSHACGAGPVLLVHDGEFVETHLRQVGFTHEDVIHALRQREYADLSNVRFAVLEADGQVNVIPREI